MSTTDSIRALAGLADQFAAELRTLAEQLDQTPPQPPAIVEAPERPVHEGRVWFTTGQAAEVAGRHPTTVTRACEVGELHGVQRKPRGRWRIHVDCLNAWCRGAECKHESNVG